MFFHKEFSLNKAAKPYLSILFLCRDKGKLLMQLFFSLV